MNTIQEIFSRDPANCTVEDMKVLIAAYRERRTQFKLGNEQAGSLKTTAKEKAASGISSVKTLSLKDLGL